MTEARAHLRHHRGEAGHCSRCAPGWGMIEPCTRGRDTKCAECQPGTYSPHHGSQPCWMCSRCGPGLYEARRCGPSTDTVCDACTRRAPENEDYRRKCESRQSLLPSVFLAPEDARNTGEQSEFVNEDLQLGEDIERERERILWEDARAQMKEDEIRLNALRQE